MLFTLARTRATVCCGFTRKYHPLDGSRLWTAFDPWPSGRGFAERCTRDPRGGGLSISSARPEMFASKARAPEMMSFSPILTRARAAARATSAAEADPGSFRCLSARCAASTREQPSCCGHSGTYAPECRQSSCSHRDRVCQTPQTPHGWWPVTLGLLTIITLRDLA